MTFEEIIAAVKAAADRPMEEDAAAYIITPETYRLWKAPGNTAKSRRRWRRRNVPNTQKMEDK